MADQSGCAVQGTKCLARSNTGVVRSNPTRGMHDRLSFFCVSVVLCKQRQTTALRLAGPVQGAVPTVCKVHDIGTNSDRNRPERLIRQGRRRRRHINEATSDRNLFFTLQLV
jgi:hypothetical protein